MSFDSASLTKLCAFLFKNMSLIVSEVMTSEKNKTLIFINGFKFCFHKLLKNDTTLEVFQKNI